MEMNLNQIKSALEKMVPAFAKKVAPLYEKLDWKWAKSGSAPHIPSVGEIENELDGQIKMLRGGKGVTGDRVGSGGVEAYYNLPDKEAGEGGEYGLSFTVSVDRFIN